MKLNFKVCFTEEARLYFKQSHILQDLKQQKFTVDAEPTDTVRPQHLIHRVTIFVAIANDQADR